MKLKGIFRKVIAWTTLINFALAAGLPAAPALAYTETSRAVSSEILASGVTLDTYNIKAKECNLKVYVTTADLSNPYVQVNTMTGGNGVLTNTKSVTNMAKETGAVAAINADFFQMNEKAPIGLAVKSGEVITSPAQRSDMYGFGITNGNVPIFDIFCFEGTVTAPTGSAFQLYGINKPTYLNGGGGSTDLNKLNMYNASWGAKSRGQISVSGGITEMVVVNNYVTEIRINQPAVAIPSNGYVLAGNGAAAQFLTSNFKVGDAVNVNYKVTPKSGDLFAAVGGQALLVQNGKRHWFSQNITGYRARTAVGASADGTKLYLVVVEGSSSSRGMTQEELADFMISIGAATAVNLDGGGSSTISARHLGDTQACLINVPTAGSERAIPSGLGIYSTAPAGPLYGMKLSGPQAVLVGTQRAYTAKGWDTYYNPYSLSQNDINWTITPELGTFQGNTLTALSAGDAMVTATYNDVTQNLPVKILGSQDIAKIELSPASIALNPGGSVDISVKVTTKQGTQFTLLPTEYSIQVNGDVGTVQNGKFTAGPNIGNGEIAVTVDSTIIKAKVSVGGVEKSFYGFETARNFAFNSAPTGSVTGGFRLTNVNEPTYRGAGAARLDYDFTKTTKTRAAYGNFKDPLQLTGQPVGLGVWVKGDQGNNHWLRARLVDADGKEKVVDLADHVNWQGWKHLKADLPGDMKYPVKLTDIYLAEVEGGPQDKGVIYLDEISIVAAPAAGESTEVPESLSQCVDVNPGQTTPLNLGSLKLSLNGGSDNNVYTVDAKQLWETDLPTTGYNPVMPLYELTAEANGDDYDKLPKPMTIQVTVPASKDLNKIHLMSWDSKNMAWKLIPSVVNATARTITGKADKMGIIGLMENARPLPNFKDIGSIWAKDVINNMAARGIVKGFPDNTYLPSKGVTRAEFVTLIANSLGWGAGSTANLKFKDTIPDWAKGSIAEAVSKGVVQGYEDGTFQPNKVINRAEMAVIIDKALGLPDSSVPSNYKDAGQIPSWAVQSIRDTKVTGLMQGSNNTFRPKAVANRAEAAAAMAKILEYYLRS